MVCTEFYYKAENIIGAIEKDLKDFFVSEVSNSECQGWDEWLSTMATLEKEYDIIIIFNHLISTNKRVYLESLQQQIVLS